jgi:hypothetical protein
MIEIKNVSKWYGPVQVLDNCSVNISKGDVVVVCGPSGSGKSTLIKTVNALEPFQKGEITVNGIPLHDPKTNLPKLRSKVGMVFQHFELFPHLSVTENLTIAQIKVLGRSPDEAKTRGLKMLDRVGLMAHKDKFPAAVRRPAAARGHCPRPGHEAQGHAVRRTHLGAGPGNDQRGPGRYGPARQGGHDHDRGHPRNGLRPQGLPTGVLTRQACHPINTATIGTRCATAASSTKSEGWIPAGGTPIRTEGPPSLCWQRTFKLMPGREALHV